VESKRLSIAHGHLMNLPQSKKSNMHRAHARKASIPNRSPENGAGRSFPSREFNPKKMPRSQKPVEPSLKGASGDLDDVVFLRLPEVKAIMGLSKSSLYALIQEKSFPAPIRLGARAVAWVRSEVKQWAAERVHASRSTA
jgi:predicted DNA-binding transcriptional regulator AlpA